MVTLLNFDRESEKKKQRLALLVLRVMLALVGE